MVGWLVPRYSFAVLKLLPVLFERIMEKRRAPCCESTAAACLNAESLAVVMVVSSLFSISLFVLLLSLLFVFSSLL